MKDLLLNEILSNENHLALYVTNILALDRYNSHLKSTNRF